MSQDKSRESWNKFEEAKLRKKGWMHVHPTGQFFIETEGGETIGVTHLTARIWESCNGKKTLKELAEEMARRSDTPLETTKEIVYSTAAEMKIAGFLDLEGQLKIELSEE